jgi:hypothetical protein
MLFGKKTKIYAPNISANVQADADVDAMMKKGGEQKLLMKVGGMVDFAEMAAKKMRMGGGTNGSKTYSGPKKRK